MKFHPSLLYTGTKLQFSMDQLYLDHGIERCKESRDCQKMIKRQITAVLAGSMAGDFLPVQLVYQGKISHCLQSNLSQRLAHYLFCQLLVH